MTETMEGVVLEATFWGAELKAVRLLPYRMDPDSFAPRRIGAARRTVARPTSLVHEIVTFGTRSTSKVSTVRRC